MLLRAPAPPPKDVDLSRTYDAVIVGSGAAGGMAAHVLTSHGLDVLMLEAGKKLDIESELKSMEWPYDHPRRGEKPYTAHALSFNEYTIRQPPYAQGTPWKTMYSYVQGWGGSDYSKNILVNEQDHPYTGTRYAWVRARVLGGKTNIWGRLALRLSDYDFKAKTHDGYGDDWPISYADVAPYYDKVDLYLGIAGHPEGLPYLPDSLFQRSTRLNAAEVRLRQSLARSGRVLTPYRAGVTTDGLKHNKYRSRCFGRGACGRHVGGCDIHAAFDSPTGLIYPALDTGHLTLRTGSIAREVTIDPGTGKARGIAFLDAGTGQALEARGRVVILAASTLESARLMLLSRSAHHPNGVGNSSGHVGHNFCEHVMGPSVYGFYKDLAGKPRTIDDGRPGGFYIARYRNLRERHPSFIRGYGFEGSSGTEMFPSTARLPGFGASYKKAVREMSSAAVHMGGFGEVLARYENAVGLDPEVKDKWGIPVLRFSFQFGDNEKKMAADMADTAREMFEEAGIEILSVDRKVLTEGWSIHELGTARMGADPKTSVVSPFQQSHDVKNLFVVDGSTHVSASCQNPTWTIMALAWRSCDYLADQMRQGNL
jgi:choline dehydrogenase-like flavoprotein